MKMVLPALVKWDIRKGYDVTGIAKEPSVGELAITVESLSSPRTPNIQNQRYYGDHGGR